MLEKSNKLKISVRRIMLEDCGVSDAVGGGTASGLRILSNVYPIRDDRVIIMLRILELTM